MIQRPVVFHVWPSCPCREGTLPPYLSVLKARPLQRPHTPTAPIGRAGRDSWIEGTPKTHRIARGYPIHYDPDPVIHGFHYADTR